MCLSEFSLQTIRVYCYLFASSFSKSLSIEILTISFDKFYDEFSKRDILTSYNDNLKCLAAVFMFLKIWKLDNFSITKFRELTKNDTKRDFNKPTGDALTH